MAADGFYESLVPDPDFAGLARPGQFRPAPDDWVVGCTDIVASTDLIAAGRYRQVNMIGAAVISAMLNALDQRPFAYVFGGDGASFAVPAADSNAARRVMALLRRWVEVEFGIALRAALVPVADIRAAGRDLRIARHAASSGVDYAMFSGGGLSWAEAQMKAGNFAVKPAPDPALPDLTGLSCRWSNLRARNGMILSLVMLPGPDPDGFGDLAAQVVALADGLLHNGHPVPETGPPDPQYPPADLMLEARISRGRLPVWLRLPRLLVDTAIAWGFFRTGLRAGGFDPVHYRAAISRNADYRKFDDGLKMTLDCDPASRDRLVAVLDRASDRGTVRYGLHEQSEAMVTCIVPSAVREDHMHFIDGADGGYALAAARIKAQDATARA
jgi:hypothetical protein